MIQGGGQDNPDGLSSPPGGQDKPAGISYPPGVKISRVGGKISQDSLPPGGQAVQGGKINCYTGAEDFLRILPYMDGHGSHVRHVTQLICINFHSYSPSNVHMNFGSKWPNCFFRKTKF